MSSLTEGISWEFPSLNSSLFSPFECNTEPKSNFEKLWTDARVLEDEIEVLKWMARRKEMEWDCAKEMVDKKKNTIKQVKKKINMVKTLNDLGPQLNVESDDDDTPFEDDDDDSNSEEDVASSATSSTFGTEVPFFVRQPSPTHKSYSEFTSEKDKNVKISVADFVCTETHFSRGHLCLNCKEKPPLFVCSVCKNHWYCSTSCQIKDWPDHQTKCCKESAKQQKKKQASNVMRNRQLIKFPLRSELLRHKSKETRQTSATTKSTNCLMCRQNLPYFLCSECRNFWYCSHKCHHDHWDEHKKFCLGGDEK